MLKPVLDILKTKKNDRKYPHTITPTQGWDSCIIEARMRGISIRAFGDTSDKIVFHPGLLPKWKPCFDYYWGEGEWGSTCCWEWSKVIKKDVIRVNEYLFKIAKKLKQKYKVEILRVSGSVKGYLSSYLWSEDEIEKSNTLKEMIGQCDIEQCDIEQCDIEDDYVLFIYC